MHDDPDDRDVSSEALEARRTAAVAQAIERSGIDEAMIDRLVRTFYGRVRDDAVLGPIFAARISDWEPHLVQISAFWSSVMLQSGRYHGRPMAAHARLPISGAHFDHWLDLFRRTARDVCPPRQAEMFIARAEMIAKSLELGLAGFRGQMLRPGERLV